MSAETVRGSRSTAPPKPSLLPRSTVTGYETHPPPGLCLKILGGQDEPTHNLRFNAPSFGENAIIFARKSLTLWHYQPGSGKPCEEGSPGAGLTRVGRES